jgi:hypothetical protein
MQDDPKHAIGRLPIERVRRHLLLWFWMWISLQALFTIAHFILHCVILHTLDLVLNTFLNVGKETISFKRHAH